MIRIAAPASACLLAFATFAAAQQPPEPPVFAKGGTPPYIGVVDGIKDGKLMLRQTQIMPMQETRNRPITRTVEVDGKVQQKTEMVAESYTVMKTVSKSIPFDLADVRAFDTDARPIPADRLPGLFAQPRMVLLLLYPQPVDPAYLKIARDGTPFLAIRGKPSLPGYAAPAAPNQPAPMRSAPGFGPPMAPPAMAPPAPPGGAVAPAPGPAVAPMPRADARPRPTADQLAAAGEVANYVLSGFNDADLRTLDRPKLRILDLYGTAITDAGLPALEGLGRLEALRLGQTGITGAGLARVLPGLTGLKSLWVQKNRSIDDAILAAIGRLPGLEDLNVYGTAVTDQGLRNLSGLKRLKRLNLGGTAITDAGLEPLKGLKDLRYINLGETRATPSGSQALRQAVPGLVVEGFGPAPRPPVDPWQSQPTTASQPKTGPCAGTLT